VTAPLILRIFAAENLPPEIPMPTAVIVREIALFLLLPLGVGMVIGRVSRHAVKISTWAVRVSILGLVIIVVGSLGSGRLELGAYGIKIPLLIFVYAAMIQTLAHRVPLHVLKFSWRDSTALSIESSMKNINLGLLIAASVFPLEGPAAEFGTGVLFVLLLYGGVTLFVSASPALLNYRREKKQPAAEGKNE
jgi:BASS family bile acid:Na+ symporter